MRAVETEAGTEVLVQPGLPGLGSIGPALRGPVKKGSPSNTRPFQRSFPSGFSSGFDLFALAMEDEPQSIPILQTDFFEAAGHFSPDGRWIAYFSDESGRAEIYVRPFPEGEGKWQVSRDGGRSPIWSADGKKIFYLSGNKMMAASVKIRATFEAGVPKMLFEVDARLPRLTRFDVTADGQRFVIAVPTKDQADLPITIVTNWQQALIK